MTSSDLWDAETAEHYDETSAYMFSPEVLDPAVESLADLAGDGPALEFAVGTGRVAVPLVERTISVSGIELAAHGGPAPQEAADHACRRRRHGDEHDARSVLVGVRGLEQHREPAHAG